MGFLPDFRNQGYGSQALAAVIEQAREHGDRFIELEVITANQPAFHLYKKFGFEVLQNLFGFTRATSSSRHSQQLQEVDIRSVANLVASSGAEDLPWQLSAESLACYGPPMKAFHHDGAYAVISDPAKPTIALMSLIVEPQDRKAGRARALLNAIAGKYDDKQLMVPAICPAQFEPLFTSSGFQRSELSQHHMRLGL